MGTAPGLKSSKLQFDGALMGNHAIERAAFASAAVDNVGIFVAPCDLTIRQFLLTVLASTTSSSAVVGIGDTTASDSYYNDLAVNGQAAGTVIEPDMTVASGAWTKKTMTKGEVLKLKLAAATAAGAVAGSLVYEPTLG